MDKKTYEVAPDVSWVNGKPVPENRRVELTEGEALYDLGLGRIKPIGGALKSKVED